MPGVGSAAAAPPTASIVNGVLAQDRPTTGALLYAPAANSYQAICSGTLIGCQTFLTAAHCVCNGSTYATCGVVNPARYSVYLQNVGIVDVTAVDVDPTYSFDHHGDVAVMTLSAPVSGVVPTPINTSLRPPLGSTVEIAGYGLTRGDQNDSGLLRRGLAQTSTCTSADPAYHVCWAFQQPLGAPGGNSNTCSGDSGGPAFADLGFGDSVVGITSGGMSGECLPDDSSFDTDVYVHRTMIESVGGADLLQTSCGSISQVGEPGTSVATFDFDLFTREQQTCRKEFSRQLGAYVRAAVKAEQACRNGVADGSRTGPCPDANTVGKVAAAEARIDAQKLLRKCPDHVAPAIDAQGACSGAADAQELADCLLAAGSDAIDASLSSSYAESAPTSAIADPGAQRCQKAIAKASATLLSATLKAATRCRIGLASGSVLACPDTRTGLSIAKAEARALTQLTAACTDGQVVDLDSANPFGGTCAGATSVAALAACEIADHSAIRDALVDLLDDQVMEADVSFSVPSGMAVLRVTLNGQEEGSNDLDLYLRAGAPATPSVYDVRSENAGTFESVQVNAPVGGTWYATIRRYSGSTLIPYQLTATTFEP